MMDTWARTTQIKDHIIMGLFGTLFGPSQLQMGPKRSPTNVSRGGEKCRVLRCGHTYWCRKRPSQPC